MSSWKKHLANVIALHARAKHLEQALHISRLIEEKLSFGELVRSLGRVEEVLDLYKKAHRMISMLADQEEDQGSLFKESDLSHIKHAIESGISRLHDVVRILNAKMVKYENNKFDLASANDTNYAASMDADALKDEIRSTLEDMSELVEYMEAPSLAKLKKELDKLMRN
jgi:hypothetical protein